MKRREFADSIAAYFAELKDPRNTHTTRHDLGDALTIAILAILFGANNFVAMEEFGTARAEWLKLFLQLPNGIPSHDTSGRVFAAQNPKQLTALFQRWTDGLATVTSGDVIAIDGKSLRRSFTSASRSALTHMVSAWSTLNGLTLAQVKTDSKSNEITAIPRLLELLDLKGALVTIDAMGCQTDIADAIVDSGGDYLLAVKRNHPRSRPRFAKSWTTRRRTTRTKQRTTVTVASRFAAAVCRATARGARERRKVEGRLDDRSGRYDP